MYQNWLGTYMGDIRGAVRDVELDWKLKLFDFVSPAVFREGAYREVFLFDQKVLGKTEKFVLKQIRYE